MPYYIGMSLPDLEIPVLLCFMHIFPLQYFFHVVWLSIEVNRGLQHCQEKCLQTLRSMSQHLGITCHIVMIADDCHKNTRDSWAILTWHVAKKGVGTRQIASFPWSEKVICGGVWRSNIPWCPGMFSTNHSQPLVKSFTGWNAQHWDLHSKPCRSISEMDVLELLDVIFPAESQLQNVTHTETNSVSFLRSCSHDHSGGVQGDRYLCSIAPPYWWVLQSDMFLILFDTFWLWNYG